MKKNNNVFNHVDNVITWTDSYYKQFANDSGKIIYSEATISDLNKIVEEIVKLYNYVIENKMYSDNDEIQDILANIYNYLNKIQINEQNAKKLDIKKAMNYWENIHNYGFKLAYNIALIEEYYKEDK